MERWLRKHGQLAQSRRGWRQRLAGALEERELPLLGDGRGRRLGRRGLGRRLGMPAVDPQDDGRLAPVELERDRRVAGTRLLVEAETG